EALRTEFQQESLSVCRADQAARFQRSLHDLRFDAGFAQSISADQSRNATTHNQDWNRRRHATKRRYMSECFREQGLSIQLLLRKVRIEDHGQIADEDSPEPCASDLIRLE